MSSYQKSRHNKYFTELLKDIDPELANIICSEVRRQDDGIELIASENFVSQATLDVLGSAVVNKTIEGYPGKRYYGGVQYADSIETLAIERAKKLFGCAYANVQPHSGSQANQAVFLALLNPGDTILSMGLAAGGHLSHGAKPSLTGKWMNVVHYGVNENTGLIDMDEIKSQALIHKPKLIICGGSSYPREIDFYKFREVADMVGAYLLADIAHFAGFVIVGLHSNPIEHAHITTTTTYKSLRGVRGGIILTDYKELADKINQAVFPGLQGSCILNNIAAKAVCFGEALKPEFSEYAYQVFENARCLAKTLSKLGIEIVTGTTDTPLVLVNLIKLHLTGVEASESLERAGLTCNKNAIPRDPQPPTITSGLRFGVAAGTTRGFCEYEFQLIGNLIGDVLLGLKKNGSSGNLGLEQRVRGVVLRLCQKFPTYSQSTLQSTPERKEYKVFELKKHSVKISGHLTSISMEEMFWEGLKSIAIKRNQSINSIVSEIDRKRIGNLSSAIRMYVYKNTNNY